MSYVVVFKNKKKSFFYLFMYFYIMNKEVNV